MVLVPNITQISEQVYIVKGASKLLLGVPGICKLGLIHDLPSTYSIKAFNVAELTPPMSKQSVVNEYPKLFSGLGKLQGEHKIHLKENATPFCLATPRRAPLPLMKNVKDKINRMVDYEPVNDPTDWCAPTVAVPKPSGAIRICVDLTKLNESVC